MKKKLGIPHKPKKSRLLSDLGLSCSATPSLYSCLIRAHIFLHISFPRLLSLDLGLQCEGEYYYYLVSMLVVYILLVFLGWRNCRKGKKLRLISVFLRSFKDRFVQFNFHFFPHLKKMYFFPFKKKFLCLQ